MRLIACWFLTDKMTRYSYSLFIAVMLAYGFWPPSFFDYLSFWRCVFCFLFFFCFAFTSLIYADMNTTFVLMVVFCSLSFGNLLLPQKNSLV